jgi:predicted DNA-binding protein
MYAAYIVRRTQIYLHEQQAHRLDERATAGATTRSALIREAIDSYLGTPDDEATRLARFKAAVETTAGIAPYLPPGDAYVDELRATGAGKLSELERRRA